MTAQALTALADWYDQAQRHYREHPYRPWLPAGPTDAFLVCCGAGPWRYGRRQRVQAMALVLAAGRDLGELAGARLFPLAWQNRYTDGAARWCREHGGATALVDQCRRLGLPYLYGVCGAPTGAKVLDLWARDYLAVPAFPVDRHVRAQLIEVGLPVDRELLLGWCRQYQVDPIVLARWLGGRRLDGGNPDWSQWSASPAPLQPPR